MRILLDTCVIIDLLTDFDSLGVEVLDLLNDPSNKLYVSAETPRELIVNFNNKKLLPKYWKTAEEMIYAIKDEANVDILPLTEAIVLTYSRLHINIAQDHRDPSDHIIISHAITEKLTLLSSDTRFWFYRNQGLDLIEY
ncbi:MAG: type II toxin-antitoxin system VapC family toxin [Prevotella sp.]|nr:type II toxin-antitoxin system VapC family toxin [Prevotella sp.]